MTPSPPRSDNPPKAPRPAAPSGADDLRLGDRIQLRKPHPCGAYVWEVTRLGADIGLRCQGCARKVLLPRAVVRKRMKAVVARATRLVGDGSLPIDSSTGDEPFRAEPIQGNDPRGERP